MSQGTGSSERAGAAGACELSQGLGFSGGASRWPWLALGVMWLVVWARLAQAWSADAEHGHGWVVPWLFFYLVYERRRWAPAAEAAPGRGSALVTGLGLLLVAVTLPVLDGNRLWPTVQWAAGGGAMIASAGLLARAGGWRWSVHYFFPLAFLTTALTWPTMIYGPVMAALSAANANLTAEVVSLAGFPAVARGNVIEVGAGFVGIDEACSGLRSLQAVWMLAWLLGEVFLLTWPRRIMLVSVGLAVAVFCNLARTIVLAWHIAAAGTAAGERWHDPAGTIAMVVTLLIVLVVAWRLARAPAAAPMAGPQTWPRLSWRWAAVVGLTMLAADGATRMWYGWHQQQASGVQWALADGVAGWAPTVVPERSLRILKASAHEARRWEDPTRGWQALAYVFRWEDDSLVGYESRYHDPTLCMPSIGAAMEARLSPVTLKVAGRALTLEGFRFVAAGTTQHVYFGIWDAFAGRPVSPGAGPRDVLADRWARLKAGRNRAAFSQVMWVLQGAASDGEAEAWVRREGARLLRSR